MRLICVVLLLISSAAFARKPTAAPKDKTDCNAKELARQDCHLVVGNYDVRLLAKTVAWSDGTWHTVDPMPLNGEAVEWEKAGFRKLSGRPILQLWLWDKGLGETKVQSLHWYVADAEKRKFTILEEGIVRKRRPEPLDVPEEDPNKPPPKKALPPPVQKYLYDGWEPHFVRGLPNGSLEWVLSGQKKILPKEGK